MNKKNPVVHFEMPYKDAARVATFYTDTFGWDMVNMGDKMQNYITAGTADTDENHMVLTPGTINGGLYPLSASTAQYPSVVISVEDIKEAMKKVTDNGGTVLGEPVEIPGIGLYVSIVDTEGNRVSLLQPHR